jgi:hypothetical protein
MKRIILVLIMGLSLILFASLAGATALTVDQVIYATDPNFNSGTLSASVDISPWDSNTFLLTLTNTTPYSTIPTYVPGTVTLTGVGFVLPAGYTISGGSAQTAWGHTPGTNTPSQWWGYTNAAEGPFLNIATLSTSQSVSTLSAVVDTKFQSGGPNSINGPKGGIAPNNEYLAYYPDSWYYFIGSASFLIDVTGGNLSANFAGFVSSIESNNVVVAFSSPNAIPEPISLILLGSGLIGLLAYGRKRRKIIR